MTPEYKKPTPVNVYGGLPPGPAIPVDRVRTESVNRREGKDLCERRRPRPASLGFTVLGCKREVTLSRSLFSSWKKSFIGVKERSYFIFISTPLFPPQVGVRTPHPCASWEPGKPPTHQKEGHFRPGTTGGTGWTRRGRETQREGCRTEGRSPTDNGEPQGKV